MMPAPSPHGVLISPALWPLRQTLQSAGLVQGSLPWQAGAMRAPIGVYWREGDAVSGARRMTIGPGPLWCLSRDIRNMPVGLLVTRPSATPTQHSRLQRNVSADGVLPADATASRARDAVALLAEQRLSQRNDFWLDFPKGVRAPKTLIAIDRRRPHASKLTDMMLLHAVENRACADILVRDEKGRLFQIREMRAGANVIVEASPVATRISGWPLFAEIDEVYSVEDEIGLQALMMGRRVICFAKTAYSERGLTTDLYQSPYSPVSEATLEDLVAEIYLDAPTYLDAWSRHPTTFEVVAQQLSWLRDRLHENGRKTICVGFSRWKRKSISRFLSGPEGPPTFVGSTAAALRRARENSGRIATWEPRKPKDLEEKCRDHRVPLLHMEDGFLRSVGLGAANLPGVSAVIDERGIYFDPSRPSDLEEILNNQVIAPELVERAARLRMRIVALGLSKYNVGRSVETLTFPEGRKIVLVPGQVEDDASILKGSPALRSNLDLLRTARERHPNAFIAFKPHPDVEAGYRVGKIDAADMSRLADIVIGGVSIHEVLGKVDHVETMTSLAGFEALLRGKSVAVHGQPFYAGWGLTEDLAPPARRMRPLLLDELVAGALILYPRYLDPQTGLRCPPEIVVDRLAEARSDQIATRPDREQRPFGARTWFRLKSLFAPSRLRRP